MSPDEVVGLAANVAIYLALIAFLFYRQMSAHPLRGRGLVLLPAALGFFGLQQLGRQSLATNVSGVALLVAGLVIGLAAGLWRGTTFQIWSVAGRVMVKGTRMTLVTWAVLIAIRLPFAFFGHPGSNPQGYMVAELLLALAVTFAAQNVVIWARAKDLGVDQAVVRDSSQKR